MDDPLLTHESYGKCAVPLRYKGIAREALLTLKFRGERYVARGLGTILAQCAAEELGGEFDCVTWVPVSPQRLRERGYDQTQMIAREVARLWETEPLRLLEKHRNNPPQSGLSAAERRANVLGAYHYVSPGMLGGARVLLIDDIVTTGATLAECVRTLHEGGAQSVVCAAVASASTESYGN
jgi:ComF family protein